MDWEEVKQFEMLTICPNSTQTGLKAAAETPPLSEEAYERVMETHAKRVAEGPPMSEMYDMYDSESDLGWGSDY